MVDVTCVNLFPYVIISIKFEFYQNGIKNLFLIVVTKLILLLFGLLVIKRKLCSDKKEKIMFDSLILKQFHHKSIN